MASDKESQKPVLPKDLFKNAFTWMFYEISKHRFPRVVSCVYLVIVLVGFWWNFADKNLPLGIVLAAVGLFGILFGLIPAWFQNVKEHPNTKKLVQQVLESNPGVDTRKWDEIANILNPFFYRENIWRTPFFFF
ncbi:hypothetical protein LQ764DRAFT_115482 [Zygosaccharomyces rouxii]|nr:hypothetical protein LQ764DRAFT_115482 [Zygosaccharomyces rouxii]